MPKQLSNHNFTVGKSSRIYPDLQRSKNHYRHHREPNTTNNSADDSIDDNESESNYSVSTHSTVSSGISTKSNSPRREIVRFPTSINHSPQLKRSEYKNPSTIQTINPKSLPLVKSQPYFVSTRSPTIQTISWLPSRTTKVKDVSTQKSVSIQTKIMSTLSMTPSLAAFAFLLLILAIAIGGIVCMTILYVKQIKNTESSSNVYKQMDCESTCVMSGTPYHTPTVARWKFDSSAADVNNIYDATYNPTTATVSYLEGNIGYAVSLTGTYYLEMSSRFLNLSYQSWTIEAWISLSNSVSEHGILTQCESSTTTHKCLTLSIKNNHLYSSFYNDDVTGATLLTVSSTKWYHIALVYDYTLRQQSLYLNGVLDGTTWGTGTLSGPYKGASGKILIGRLSGGSYFYGKIDHLHVSNGAKSACEILNDAILTVYYSFDSSALNIDLSNNNVNGISNSLTTVSGLINEAYLFNQTLSYFQSFAFTAYNSGESFSIALWIKPYSVAGGTIIHMSTNIGGGGTACFDLLGFTSAGQLIGSLYSSDGCCFISCTCHYSTSITGPIISANIWTHIVFTYSLSNGMAIYTNGTLKIQSTTVFTSFSNNIYAFTIRPYMTVGNDQTTGTSPTGCIVGSPAISSGPYVGLMDELRLYSRVLSTAEICSLYNY